MRITLVYNLKTKDIEEQAELLLQDDIDRIAQALRDLEHTVTPVEASGKTNEIIEKLIDSEPEFIFNVAEGIAGEAREAFYPIIYDSLSIPYTGSDASLLSLTLNKHLTKTILGAQGINVPKGTLVSENNRYIPDDLKYPLFIKPNFEGSSKGITQESVVLNEAECQKRIDELLPSYPEGLVVEEFIKGRELSVPMLEAFLGQILDIVEHTFDLDSMNVEYNIYDFDAKFDKYDNYIKAICPAELSENELNEIVEMARKVFKIMNCKDMGRVDVRLSEDGIPYFIEINPLPSLHPEANLMIGANTKGLSYKDVIELILKSAVSYYQPDIKRIKLYEGAKVELPQERPTLRKHGISIGYFNTGINNSITDVKGVKVGHLTYIKDDIEIAGSSETTCIRTGITSIIPVAENIYENPIPAGGFVLNGMGELAGITQILEWEWLETPILLCNTMSVGRVHDGIITYMLEQYPSLNANRNVIIPVVGETDDSFLNDTRIRSITAPDVRHAMNSAKSGRIQQGSVGAGTGMTTFDFAGGIGTSSRVIPNEQGDYTVGALVLSNFGKMRNLTIDGTVVGRELDKKFPYETRRSYDAGSIIIVIATDAPLLSSQLNRVSRRAALGLGRTGSHARTTSGEIIISFSTGNQISREKLSTAKHLDMRFVSDTTVNLLYEAVIESVEEAVVNAIFCSPGMKGQSGNYCPPIPHEDVIKMLEKVRK